MRRLSSFDLFVLVWVFTGVGVAMTGVEMDCFGYTPTKGTFTFWAQLPSRWCVLATRYSSSTQLQGSTVKPTGHGPGSCQLLPEYFWLCCGTPCPLELGFEGFKADDGVPEECTRRLRRPRVRHACAWTRVTRLDRGSRAHLAPLSCPRSTSLLARGNLGMRSLRSSPVTAW